MFSLTPCPERPSQWPSQTYCARHPSNTEISNVLQCIRKTHDLLVGARTLLFAAELLLGHAECLVAVILLACSTLLVRVDVHTEVLLGGM